MTHLSSPRGVQALVLGGKLRALLDGRWNVSFADVRATALAALRHRLPTHTLTAPQWQRGDRVSRAFEAAAWARQPLLQWLMRRPLGAAPA